MRKLVVDICFNKNCNPPSETNYLVDVMIWNKAERWGYMTVKLHGNGTEVVANIDQ